MSTFFSKGYVQTLLTIILLGAIAALGAYAYYTYKAAGGVYTGQLNISVRGTGEILAKPDIGQFSFSVLAEGENAAEAQDASAEAVNAIIAYLTEAGVDEDDIKTQYYNLNPKYRYEERVCAPNMYCPPGERVTDGYEVSQSIMVKVRDLDQSGELISGVGERGATNISNLQLTIDDESVLKAQAREQAITDAQEKAQELAEDLGVRLVRMTSYWEDEGPYYPAMGYGGEMMAMDASEEAMVRTAPSIPTGENTITSNVTISYEVR